MVMKRDYSKEIRMGDSFDATNIVAEIRIHADGGLF